MTTTTTIYPVLISNWLLGINWKKLWSRMGRMLKWKRWSSNGRMLKWSYPNSSVVLFSFLSLNVSHFLLGGFWGLVVNRGYLVSFELHQHPWISFLMNHNMMPWVQHCEFHPIMWHNNNNNILWCDSLWKIEELLLSVSKAHLKFSMSN